MNDSPTIDPEIEQKIENTESVVHQTYEDLDTIGDDIEKMVASTDSIKKILRRFFRDQENFKREVKTAMATEVEKQLKPFQENYKKEIQELIALEIQNQMKPIEEKLDKFLTTKPKVVYIKFSIPNPLSWFIHFFYGNRNKRTTNITNGSAEPARSETVAH